MGWNYDFCIASVLVLLILVIYNGWIIENKNFTMKMYIFLLILSCASCVTDMFSGMVLMRKFKDIIWVNYLGEMFYYSTQHAIPCCYFVYITLISKKINYISGSMIKWLIPGAIEQVLIYTTHLTGWMFVYDENGYHRGPFMWILIVGTGFYLTLGLLSVLSERRNIEKRYRVVSVIFLVVPAFAVAIQMLHIDLILISASIAISCLIMQLILQNPRMIYEVNEKEIEARLAAEEANRAKSTFLANMSHEIRTPMNAICGMADILAGCDIEPQEMDYVQTIQTASKNLLDIINEILDFSKVDAGKLELCPVNYRLDEMLRDVENITAARIYGKNIDFEIYVKAGVPVSMNGDSTKIHQILVNILGNAAKYTEKGTIVLDVDWLSLSDNKVRLIFRVSDTGIGIREEDISKLFIQFSQVDTVRNRKIGGTGLGLALSKGIARLMNGDIDVTSEYGKGSTFTINIEQDVLKYETHDSSKFNKYIAFIYEENLGSRQHLASILSQIGLEYVLVDTANQVDYSIFEKYRQENKIFLYNYRQFARLGKKPPDGIKSVALIEYNEIVQKSDEFKNYIRKPYDIFKVFDALFSDKQSKLDTKHIQKAIMKNVHIAIVDDNKVNLKVAATQLREWKVFAETFSSGGAIIKALERGRQYDIIFMDHMMPELDGIETTAIIRAMDGEYFKNVPIIALTANAIRGVQKEYEEAGMNDCLFKPVQMEQLEEKLIAYLPEEKVEIVQ